jgi:hypothetical protein
MWSIISFSGQSILFSLTFIVLSFLCNLNVSVQSTVQHMKDLKLNDRLSFLSFYKTVQPSITRWETVETPGHFSILSMQIDHHQETSWFMNSLHMKDSIGWNRTIDSAYGRRPYACTIRFYGVGFEKTLAGYQTGGTGYMSIGFSTPDKKKFWHGFDKNETYKVHCYYSTNKDTGSEFLVSFLYLLLLLLLFIFLFIFFTCNLHY